MDDLDLYRGAATSDDSDSDSDGSDGGGSDGGAELQVDFEFKDPSPDDYFAVKVFMERYLPSDTQAEADTGSGAGAGAGSGAGSGASASAGGSAAVGTGASAGAGAGATKPKAKRGKKRGAAAAADGLYNPGAVSDVVVEQAAVGTLVKAGSEPDVYAFVTVLPVVRYAAALKPVLQYFTRHAPSAKAKQLKAALADPHTALLLNERMVCVCTASDSCLVCFRSPSN